MASPRPSIAIMLIITLNTLNTAVVFPGHRARQTMMMTEKITGGMRLSATVPTGMPMTRPPTKVPIGIAAIP